MKRWVSSGREWLPRGTTLPDAQWEGRHRGMIRLLWAHAVLLPLLALGYGNPVDHALLEGAIISAFALPATLLRGGSRRPQALLVSLGLLTCSATLVHIMQGAIEAHFHYFVMVSVLSLYEDWSTYLTAIAYVLFQHGIGSLFAQHYVFAHEGGPWLWAGVHTAFIAAQSLANIVNWRAAENLRMQLAAHARDLERSNRELEEFAYVASHDLAEPLRSVSAYLELIEQRTELDDQSKQFFAFAQDGAGRMRRLIDDLLRYSRTGRTSLQRRSVPAEQIVDETLRSLAAEIESTGARIEHDQLPVVEADPVLLGQVFQNLVANAVKFRDDDPPVVRVTGRELPGRWEFAVTDNGIGIPPERAGQIFKMFQRLHHRDQYEGTGIGLSICQRIVERHGGEIRVEPVRPGRGSRFVFTIADPRQEAIGGSRKSQNNKSPRAS